MHSTLASGSRYPGPVKVAAIHSHGLNAPEFSSDEALARVLDHYPSELIDINQYTFDDNGQHSLKTGVRGKLSGEEIISAIRNGELWVNLRCIEHGWPQLWAAASDNFADIAEVYSHLHAVKRSGQLIISSPRTRVPYHFDAAGVVLFHMRGSKRVFVYPGDEVHLPEEAMERVVAKQTTEELPYTQAFERDATVFDLMPGEALVWPLFAPHRVENVDAFCVSLSMDYQTWESRWRNGALFTHAVMRKNGMNPRFTDKMGKAALAVRWALSLVLRRTGVLTSQIANIERSFEVDAARGSRAI